MSKKNNYRKLLRSNKSERYKMYKSGKHWVYATITSFTGIAGLSIVHRKVFLNPKATPSHKVRQSQRV